MTAVKEMPCDISRYMRCLPGYKKGMVKDNHFRKSSVEAEIKLETQDLRSQAPNLKEKDLADLVP